MVIDDTVGGFTEIVKLSLRIAIRVRLYFLTKRMVYGALRDGKAEQPYVRKMPMYREKSHPNQSER